MVRSALKRPITILVLFIGLLLFAVMALRTIPVDIFPKLNLPTIYVIESYGGMSPQQMEGFFATRFQDRFLYVSGINTIESRNIQGLTILKLTFYENTDMAEAASEVASQVNRALKFFPPGALPPEVMRFDASSLPVGELVFSSKTRSLQDIYELVATRTRPMFATVPGLMAPHPLGANARSIVINVDPEELRSYNVSPDEVVAALAKNNLMTPSGNILMGNDTYLTTNNSLEKSVEDFQNIPIVTKGFTTIFIGDVAKVQDAADITVNYALINGTRSVYLPVVKTATASTWDVVKALKARLPEMKSLLPDDVKISYEFDQSVFVINAVKSLMTEGILGAILTGLMVLLFLRDWRSCLIVVITIPVSIISSILFLRLAGQTINLMTLSGLSLAIGILVDMATVTIENIHQHLEMGKNKRLAIYDACEEISFPLLLILLCILAVFAPSFVMTGVPKAMFLPLSLSIGFAMIISYFAAQTLVPVLSNWILKTDKYSHYKHGEEHSHAAQALDRGEVHQVNKHMKEELKEPKKNDFFEKIKIILVKGLEKLLIRRNLWVIAYFIITVVATGACFYFIGKDMLPKVNSGQFQLHIREPEGTRLERTEEATHKVLSIIDSTVDNHVSISSSYVGLVPSAYATNNLYVANSGTNEAIIQVGLKEDYKTNIDDLKEKLRANIHHVFPEMGLSFEPIELTEKIMSQGATNPVEVRVAGKNMNDIETYADKIVQQLKTISYLRDVEIQQPLKVPSIHVHYDRLKMAQMGLDFANVTRSVTDATSSSRFTEKNQWLDTKVAYTYQVQVEVPQYIMDDVNQLKNIPLVKGSNRPILSDIATFSFDSIPGEFDRSGPRRFVTVSANIYKKDLASASKSVQNVISNLGNLPPGLKIEQKGMSDLLTDTFSSLQNGLLVAIIVILLLLAANFQSFKLSITVLTTVPAVILGSLGLLLITGSTLNLQSYMGIIMAIGVSVANAILIVTNAEKLRPVYHDATKAAKVSASIRLRPILMTSLAMIAGMIPMATGFGESGDQTAPLGRAVIGGLAVSTFAALFIVPLVYSWFQQKETFESVSLLPENLNN
jgi:multidrug efflux pump subunit AcrB